MNNPSKILFGFPFLSFPNPKIYFSHNNILPIYSVSPPERAEQTCKGRNKKGEYKKEAMGLIVDS